MLDTLVEFVPSVSTGLLSVTDYLVVGKQHGHEFLEFEFSNGRLRYANNSKCVQVQIHFSIMLMYMWSSHSYRNDSLIRKERKLVPICSDCQSV